MASWGFGVLGFWGDGGEWGEWDDGGDGGGEVDQGGYPPSDLECLSRQDSENIAHC